MTGHPINAHCPYCGRHLDLSASATGRTDPPGDGDFSICFTCRGVAVFTAGPFGLQLRPATPAEIVEVEDDAPGVRRWDRARIVRLLRGGR